MNQVTKDDMALARRYECECKYADAARVWRAIGYHYDAARCTTNHNVSLLIESASKLSAQSRKPKPDQTFSS